MPWRRARSIRGVADLSRQLGFSKSNTFHILSTFASEGYVRSESETRRYTLTLKLWELGVRVIGPAERFTPDRMLSISTSVMNSATRISESLGATSPAFAVYASAS